MILARLKTPLLDLLRINSHKILRTSPILILYILIFTLLDFLTRSFQIFPNVVAWYPPHGVSFALLLALGWQFAPALVITSLISSFFVYKVSLPIEVIFGWSALVAIIYGVASRFLHRRVQFDPQLRSMRDIMKLIIAAAIVSAILSVIAISGDPPSGTISLIDKVIAALTWWIGEMIGILVITPFLLIHVMPLAKQFLEGNSFVLREQKLFVSRPKNIIARALSLLIVLYLAFGVPALKPFQPIYLIAVPLVWISLDHGIKGASAGIMFVNFATTYTIWFFHPDLSQLSAIQLLMLVLAIASLLMGIVRTEQLQITKELGRSEQRFRALVANSLEEVSLVSADGTLIFESPTTRGSLGYPPGSFVDHSIFELFHPDDRAAAVQMLEEVIHQPGVHREALFRLRRMDGTWCWMEGVVNNLLDEPAVQAIVINYRDITERKEAEETLRVSEDRYRDLVDNSQDLICTHDLEGRLLSVNPFAEQLLGYPGSTLIQMNIRDLLAPESQRLFHVYLYKLKKRGYAAGTMVVQTIKGEKRIWEYKNTLRTEGVARPIVRGIARDVTDRKQAEEEIRIRTSELSALYALSRALAEAADLDQIFEIVNRHAVESLHITFAQISLLEDDKFITKAVYPIRVLDLNLPVVNSIPVDAIPYSQRILEQNESVVIYANDPKISNEERAALFLNFAQSVCLIPLRSSSHESKSNQDLGLLILGEARSEIREPFSTAKVRLAQSIGDQTSVAIRRLLLQEQTERRLHYLTALREIDKAITSSFGLHLSMKTVLTQAIDQLHIDAAAIWLFRPDSAMLEYFVGHGFHSKMFEQAKPLRLGEGYAGRAIAERQTIHISNLMTRQDNPRLMPALESDAFVSYYAVPLIAREDIKGVLEVFHRVPLEPDQEWLNFLNTLAGQAAIAIDNATLFDNLLRSNYQLTQAYDATIEGWSVALDLRDKETEGHTQRVTEMTITLAKAMGLTEHELVPVRRGALLHDIGKMGVPDRILLKPDKLTDDEWVMMRKHPQFAHDMLSPIQYLQGALDIPYCHHEKWDGTGYPRGLKGEQIPLTARIFAIVDVWDALTSDRPYRSAWSSKKTLEYISSLSGSHFDPRVVEAFLQMKGQTNYVSAADRLQEYDV
jgi:PAS domain S-box-containing protein